MKLEKQNIECAHEFSWFARKVVGETGDGRYKILHHISLYAKNFYTPSWVCR